MKARFLCAVAVSFLTLAACSRFSTTPIPPTPTALKIRTATAAAPAPVPTLIPTPTVASIDSTTSPTAEALAAPTKMPTPQPTPVESASVTPEAEAQSAEPATVPPEAKTQSAEPATVTHAVRPGENLFRIGLQVDVPWQDIAWANNIINPSRIQIGQELVIPVSGTYSPPPLPATHLVAAGENLYRIGLFYQVPWPTIAAANSIINPHLIQQGMTLTVPAVTD